MAKVVAILQARVASKRLPGKVLLKLGDCTVLEHQMKRVEPADIDQYWIATTRSKADDPICSIAEKRGWNIHRGDETDVLSRFKTILETTKAPYFFRLTGDNPMTGSDVLNSMMGEMNRLNPAVFSMRDVDNDRVPLGLVPELLRTDGFLCHLPDGKNLKKHHTEHVTSHAIEKRGYLRPKFLENLPKLDGPLRLTVDYPEDLQTVTSIVTKLGGTSYSLQDVLMLIREMGSHDFSNLKKVQRSFLETNE